MQQYWAKDSQPYKFVPVTTFAEAFQKTELGKGWNEALETPFQRPEGFPDELDPLQRTRYHLDLKFSQRPAIRKHVNNSEHVLSFNWSDTHECFTDAMASQA